MMRETDCGHCHICHGLLTILKRIENCSLFVSERIEPATCWRHLSNDKTLLVFTEVVASITTYYLFLNTIYSIKTKMCWLLVCYALLGVFATSQTQTVGNVHPSILFSNLVHAQFNHAQFKHGNYLGRNSFASCLKRNCPSTY